MLVTELPTIDSGGIGQKDLSELRHRDVTDGTQGENGDLASLL